jgi:hypothetical protein
MPALKDCLFDLEEGFWEGDAEFYRLNADAKCLVAFPGMVQVLENEALAGTVTAEARWKDVSFSNETLYCPTPNVAVIAYEASARKGDGEPQTSSVTSGYVERDGKWKLAWHHHTPLS